MRAISELRVGRIRKRILNALVESGPVGLKRTKLVDAADHNDYRAGAQVLDQMCAEHRVFRFYGRYGLSISSLDEIAIGDLDRVRAFFDLRTEDGQLYRRFRQQWYGVNVMLGPGGMLIAPPYVGGSPYDTEAPPYAVTDFWPEPKARSFWDLEADAEHCETQQLAAAGFWA